MNSESLLIRIVAGFLYLMVQCASAQSSVTFTAASDVGISASSYSASGVINITLAYPPSPFDDLTVIENTGIGPISGAFTNLNQGDELTLAHSGSDFTFVADYFGGTGNDLVLAGKGRQGISWGDNDFGQLGNGAVILVKDDGVLRSKAVTKVAAGGLHSLALCSDGTVAAWGSNLSGQLGDGNSSSSPEPVLVDHSGVLSGKVVTDIAAGSDFSLALCEDGTLVSWGDGDFGRLGNGDAQDQNTPVLVTDVGGVLDGKTIISISAGAGHSAVLCQDGTIATWGSNFQGQLGIPESIAPLAPVPVPTDLSGVLAGKKVVQLDAGDNHTLALTLDGTLVSWGEGSSGRLGHGSNSDSDVPVLVDASGVLLGKTVVSISAGGAHSLVLCTDGSIIGWGENSSGQLGAGSNSDQNRPVTADLSGAISTFDVMAVHSGGEHSVAITTTGKAFGWGRNNTHAVGDGMSENVNVPVPVETSGPLSTETPTLISAGSGHNLALLQSGRIAAWGNNNNGHLGSGPDSELLQAVASGGVLSGKTLVEVSAGENFALGLTADGMVVEWGEGSLVPTSIDQSGVLNGKTVTSISAGGGHRLALCSDGTVVGWGKNSTGQLGDGTTDESETPVLVDQSGALSEKIVVAISAGDSHSLVLCSDGTLSSWGRNRSGLLGDGTTVSWSTVPVLVDQSGVLSGKTVIQIATGATHSLVLCSDGILAAWGGSSRSAALGTGSEGSSPLPVLVDQTGVLASKSVSKIATGSLHSLALCSDGTIAAWGENGDRQLGDNSTSDRSSPVLVDQTGALLGETVVAIAGGEEHSIALTANGTLFGWGRNTDGQIGSTNVSSSGVPVEFDDEPFARSQHPIAISAASDFNIAISAEIEIDPYLLAVEAAGLSDDDAEPDAIPFNDGLTNLLKFSFNMNLAGPDTHSLQPGGLSGLPSGRLVAEEGPLIWRYEFIRRSDAGLTYVPLKSITLEEGSFSPMTGTVTIGIIDDIWERVTIDEPLTPPESRKFFGVTEVSRP